ncbi:HAT [Theobroma cacao]|nr:HAT [Theobroma cacao]
MPSSSPTPTTQQTIISTNESDAVNSKKRKALPPSYLMLETTQKFEEAFVLFEEADSQYRTDLLMGDGIPKHEDWENVRRKKLVFVEFCLRKMYSNEQASSICVSLKKTMEELLVEYQKNVQPPLEKVGDNSQSKVSQISEFDDNVDSSASVALLNEFKRYKIVIGKEEDKSELEKYLSLNEPDATDSDDFDVFIWWKLNSHRYPTLALLAHDVLAIPPSTIASESAFSTGGRVLDAYKSSLMPKMVQALICA